MNGSRDFARGHIRTALGFEHTDVAVVLSGAIADRAVLRDALARRGESEARFSQLLTPGTDIEVAFSIECEVAAGESSVRALGLVDQVHMRLRARSGSGRTRPSPIPCKLPRTRPMIMDSKPDL